MNSRNDFGAALPQYPIPVRAYRLDLRQLEKRLAIELETHQAIERALVTLRSTFSKFPQLTIHSIGYTGRTEHQRIGWRDNPLFSGTSGPIVICPSHAVIPVYTAIAGELERLRGELRRSTLRGAA